MNKKMITSLALAIAIVGSSTPSTQAYFRTIEGVNNLRTPQVVPTRYYNLHIPHFRSQSGRSVTSLSPATPNYNRRENRSIASDTMAQGSIRSLFARVGLSQDNKNPHYDNDQFNDSTIKFRTLTSHTCFEPVGSEIARCKKRFGMYYNLQASILDGSIYEILVENNAKISANITPLYNKMVAELQVNNASPVVPVAVVNTILLRDRMQIVWDRCKNHTTSHRAAAMCYIQNDRQYLDNGLLGSPLIK